MGRPLQLVLRGGLNAVPKLRTAFRNIILVDSDAHMKSMHRYRLYLDERRMKKAIRNPLPNSFPVDQLFEDNIRTKKTAFALALAGYGPVQEARPSTLRARHDARKETLQLDFLGQLGKPQRVIAALDNERVITTPKSEKAA